MELTGGNIQGGANHVFATNEPEVSTVPCYRGMKVYETKQGEIEIHIL